MACSACPRSRNSTNAKPRGRPVSRSTGSTTCEGGATVPKYARRSASVVLYDRFPTKRRTGNQISLRWTLSTHGGIIEPEEGARDRRRTHAGSRSSEKTLPEVLLDGKRELWPIVRRFQHLCRSSAARPDLGWGVAASPPSSPRSSRRSRQASRP